MKKEKRQNIEEREINSTEAKEIIEALRNDEIDAIVNKNNVRLLRLQEVEEQLIKQRDQLKQLVDERDSLVTALKAHEEELKIQAEELRTQADELRSTQLAAQESRDKYVDLYDYAPVGYISLDKNSIILEANLSAARLLGLERKKLLQSQFTKFIAPESQDAFYFHRKKVLESGKKHSCEVCMQKTDGSGFEAQLDCIGIRYKGKLDHIRINFSDITERKQMQQQLSKTLQLLNAHMENSPLAVIEFDPEFRVTRWSQEAEKIFGWTKEETLGKAINQMKWVYVEDAVVIERLSADFMAGKIRSYTNKNRNYRKDGSVINCEWYNSAITDSNGKLVSVLSLVLDVTQRKQTEAALRASEKENRELLETANSIILRWKADGTLKFVNDFGLRFFGYSKEEIIGKSVNMLLPNAETSGRNLETLASNVLEHPEQYISITNENIRKDGSLAYISWTNRAIYDENGKIKEILAIGNDVTERQQAEIAVAKAKNELEAKVKERTRRLARANKQLRQYSQRIMQVQEEERKRIAYELHDDTAQYLAILKLQLDSILSSNKIQDLGILQKLEYLEKDASRAVDDVRRYSHELRPSVLDSLGLLAAMEQVADDINKLKQMQVDLVAEGEEPSLSDDVKLSLFRIAQEALNNARKHAKASQVTIRLQYDHRHVKLSITDNGVGFNPQASVVRSKQKGSLGLMSMRERAQLVGANLKIESEPGHGAAVIVEIVL